MLANYFNKLRSKAKPNQKAITFFVCFLISAIFWFVTSMSKPYETSVEVPVSYRHLPITKQIEGTLPSHLTFYFKGSGFEMSGIHLNQLPDSIIVDLNLFISQGNAEKLQTINLGNQFKGKVKPFKVEPEVIIPGISSRKGKRVPVNLVSDISYRDRFGIAGSIELNPDSVNIAGPAHLLKKVQSINTQELIINDLHKSSAGELKLNTDLPKGIQVAPTAIQYKIKVEEYTEGTLTLPVSLPPSQRGKVSLYPPEIKVTYLVELSKYNAVKADQFRFMANVPVDGSPAALEVELIKAPSFVHGIKWEPKFVDYLIKE